MKQLTRHFLLVILVFIVTVSLVNVINQTGLNKFQISINSVTIDENILYSYNSTSTEQNFTLELNNFELQEYNSITIFFLFLGDKTDSNGMVVTFYLNQTKVEIILDQIYQDSVEHSFSKSFSYPIEFVESMNITISCKGKTSYFFESGSFQILSTSTIEPIDIPVLDEIQTVLPCNPSQLGFYGLFSGVKSEYVETAVYSLNDSSTLNVTLSFDTNSFSANSQYLEAKINDTIIKTESFPADSSVTVSMAIPLIQGKNIIRFHFCVYMCMGEIWFTNIVLSGKLQVLEDLIPEDCFDWFPCNNPTVDCTFNLSSFKPFSVVEEQNLLVSIYYEYIGSEILPILDYQLLSKSDVIFSGNDLFSHPNGITFDSYTLSYSSDISFRVYGTTTEEGIFCLLNSSKIEIEPVPTIDINDTLEKIVASSETYDTPSIGALTVNFKDVIYFDSQLSSFNLSFSLNLYNEFLSPVDQFILRIKLNGSLVFFQSFNNKQTLTDDIIIEITREYQEIEFILSIYGGGLIVTLEELSYVLSAAPEETTSPSNPFVPPNQTSDSKPINPSKITLMSISMFLDVIALVILIWHLDKKNKKTNRNAQVELDEEKYELLFNGGYAKTERFFNFNVLGNIRKVLLAATGVYIVLKNVSYWLILEKLVTIASNETASFSFVFWGKFSFNLFTTILFASSFFWFTAIINSSTNTFYKDLHNLNRFFFKYVKYIFPVLGALLFIYMKINHLGKLFPWSIITSVSFSVLFLGYMQFGKQKKEQSEPSLAEFFTKRQVFLSKIGKEEPIKISKEVIETTTESITINLNKVETNQLFCYYCDALLERVDDGGPLICLNCGKKTRKCEICMKYMVANEELVQIIDCGHIFHRNHLIEWMKVKRICPTCKREINDDLIINL